MIPFFFKMRWAVAVLLLFVGKAATAQFFSISCQSYTTSIAPNGVAVITPQNIDGGSVVLPGGSLVILAGGAQQSALTLDCNSLTFNPNGVAFMPVQLAMLDSLGGTYDTCTTNVYIFDTLGYCGGSANAVCNGGLILDIAPNGYAVVTAAMIDGGSTGGSPYIINYNNPGTWNSAYTYTCADLGTHTVYLAVADSANTVSTCTTTVTIIDTTNICGGQNVGYVIDSFYVDATDCNTCDGQYSFGYLLDANGNYFNAAYIVWNDGVVGGYRNDLCPNLPYSFTAYDANQNAYAHTIYVGCGNNPLGGGCIDPLRIDTGVVCPTVYAPVCGCDGVTYSNDCEAYYMNGVTSWTPGPCQNNSTIVAAAATGNTGCDPNACTGYAVITAASVLGMPAAISFFWSDGSVGATRQGLCAGVYTVYIVDSISNASTYLTVVIGTAQGCVWPGDTDDNTAVNNWDLLPIALAYGESGVARVAQDNNWEAHAATDWNTANPLMNMPNYKHIDCDGSGLIDVNDTQALSLNYGQSYYRSASNLAGTIPLFVGSTTTQEGVRIGLPIHFGTATDVAEDIYGLAFTVHYDPTMVTAGSVDVDFVGSWLGTDLLTIVKDFPALGVVEIGVARKDRQNITNFGQIGTLNLTISDDILRSSAVELMDVTVSTVLVVDNSNRKQGADVQTGVVTVELNTAIDNVTDDYKVTVFPNPSRDIVNINVTGTWIEDLQLMTATGQIVTQQLNVAANTATVDVAKLPAGVYLLSVTTEKGIQHERIHVIR